jgi:hypothetical protein
MTLHDSLYYATPDDIAFFEQATAGLPKRLPDEPYHCGPQNVAAFRYAFYHSNAGKDKVSWPPRILEIGFNLGHSAACWLEFGCEVTSVDVRIVDRTKLSVDHLKSKYGRCFVTNRCEYENGKSIPYDLSFVDGAHDYDSVCEDIVFLRSHGIQRFLFDDWYPHHGPGVQQAVFDAGLLPLAVIGSMAYCEEPSLRGFVKQPEIV